MPHAAHVQPPVRAVEATQRAVLHIAKYPAPDQFALAYHDRVRMLQCLVRKMSRMDAADDNVYAFAPERVRDFISPIGIGSHNADRR